MKISELIKDLAWALEHHGDMDATISVGLHNEKPTAEGEALFAQVELYDENGNWVDSVFDADTTKPHPEIKNPVLKMQIRNWPY